LRAYTARRISGCERNSPSKRPAGPQFFAENREIRVLALHLPRANGMRGIRRFSQLVLTLGGGALVVYAMYYLPTLRERVLYASLGLVIMEVGIWQVTSFLFPNDRAYKPLRKETDYFLKLVRRLNRAAVAAERGSENARVEIDRVYEDMHHSVERMKMLAGVTGRVAERAHTAPMPVVKEPAH
jgi:hypothetical protein